MVSKIHEEKEHTFNKLHVRVKPEFVNFRLEEDVNNKKITWWHLALTEPNDILQDQKNNGD
jgi:predicted sulfurtransferase